MKKLKVIAILLAITTLTNVHAVLQSREGVAATKITPSDFFQKSREMEAEGGILGLNATFAENASTGEYEETSVSNNIDTHMVKNTEWGAVAMLSESKYGAGHFKVSDKCNTSTYTYDKSASTTGNMSGIFGINEGIARYEAVAGGIVSRLPKSIYGGYKYLATAHSRYVDNYEDSTDQTNISRYIPGDATYEIMRIDSRREDYYVTSSSYLFQRGSWPGGSGVTAWYGSSPNNVYSRTCIWVGEGI